MVPAVLRPVARAAGKVALKLQTHAPEILTGIGIAGMGAAVYSGCKASTKLDSIMDDYDEHKDKVKLAKDIGRSYGPCVTLFVASACCIGSAVGILNHRVTDMAIVAKGIEKGFNLYRSRVIEDQGPEKDILYRHGLEKVTELVPDDKGVNKPVTKYKKADIRKAGDPSIYARVFDEWNPNHSKDPVANLCFVRAQMAYAQQLLMTRGYLFLSEVYSALGFTPTKASQIVGWSLKKNPNSFVDFGIYDLINDRKSLFINGEESNILLDFNVDGCILEYADE